MAIPKRTSRIDAHRAHAYSTISTAWETGVGWSVSRAGLAHPRSSTRWGNEMTSVNSPQPNNGAEDVNVPEGAFPLSSVQRSMWFAQQLSPTVPEVHRPVHRVAGRDRPGPVERSRRCRGRSGVPVAVPATAGRRRGALPGGRFQHRPVDRLPRLPGRVGPDGRRAGVDRRGLRDAAAAHPGPARRDDRPAGR